MKKEVIELEAIWYSGGFHFRLEDDKKGFVRDSFNVYPPYKIEDNKIVYFWERVEELEVWKWKKNILIGSKNMKNFLMVVVGHLN